MESSIVIKVKYGETMRRFNVRVVCKSICLNINELKQKILHLFKIPCDAEITLTYIDEDGDEITLADDDDLKDVVRQELDPLRISVKLNNERFPIMQPSFQNGSTGISEHFKAGTKQLHETLIKLSADMASKVTTSAPPVISELAEAFSKMGNLNQLLETQSNTEPHLQKRVPQNASGVTENKSCVDRIPHAVNVVLKPTEAPVKKPNEPSLTTAPESEAFIGSAVRDPEPTMFKADARSSVDGKKFGDSGLVREALGISRSSVPSIIKNKANDSRDCTGFGSINLSGSTRSDNPLQSIGYLCDSSKISHDSSLSSVPPHCLGFMDRCHFSGVQRADNPSLPQPVHFGVPREGSHSHIVGTNKILHKGVRCDGCGAYPITGPRFKSKVKDDYDLCIICFCKMGCSDTEYIRIDRPHARVHPPYMYRGIGVKTNRPKLDSSFVEDVNILDGTIITPSTQFTKIWRIRNNGNTFWPKGTQLVWIGGDILSDAMSVDLEITAAGFPVDKELDVAVDFVAPNNPGRYISYWSMASPLGQKFGQRVWVLIQVVASTEEPVRTNPAPENLRGFNLNLPPASSSLIIPEMIDVNLEPVVGDSHPEPILSCNAAELVGPVIEGASSMKEQEVNFPITDSLIAGFDSKGQPALPATTGGGGGGGSSISYHVVDVSSVAPAIAPAPMPPHINVVEPAQGVNENNSEVELSLLRELEGMGFKQVDLNKEILRLNKYDLEQSVNDLCGVSEWDPILEELEEMGFSDKEVNKELLKKNGGSIKRVVMDLITR
ncbi:hypothetical protein DM860_011500 [Cuscuta australis]|uniref:ZZ-type domain-containing protein n=1 Tax=Cuscuta australis TaxID=267555 RepID=A0A328D0J6_9ASTE|nr:hypothetical protein DM860_011500 [Cuscuta australis]